MPDDPFAFADPNRLAEPVDYSISRAANTIYYEFINGVQTIVGNGLGDKPAAVQAPAAQPAGPAAALSGIPSPNGAGAGKGASRPGSTGLILAAAGGGVVLLVLAVLIFRR